MAQTFVDVLPELDGLNEDHNPEASSRTQLSIAHNCARRGKETGTRPGLIYDETIPIRFPQEYAIQGGHTWQYDQGSSHETLVVANGFLWANGAQQTPSGVTMTAGQDLPWVFSDTWTGTGANSAVFFAGGAAGDTFNYWDGGANYNALTPAGTTTKPKFCYAKWGFVFAGGFSGTGVAENPMVVRYPDFASDYTVGASWNAANTIGGAQTIQSSGPEGPGGEYLTGLGEFSDNRGDWLMLLGNKKIYAARPDITVSSGNPFVVQDAVSTGCVHQRAYVNLGLDAGDAMWVGFDGIHSLRLAQEFGERAPTARLSDPIIDTWDSLDRSRLWLTSGGFWADEAMVVFAVSTASSTVQNLLLACSIRELRDINPGSVRWYRWETNLPLDSGQALVHVNSIFDGRPSASASQDFNRRMVYMGSNKGDLGRFSRTAYSDLGQAYRTEFQTKHDDKKLSISNKTCMDLYVLVGPGGDYRPRHQYVFDYGSRPGSIESIAQPRPGLIWDVGKWDEAYWSTEAGIQITKMYGRGSGNTIAHNFSHQPSAELPSQPFFVGKISQQMSVTGEESIGAEDTQGSS